MHAGRSGTAPPRQRVQFKAEYAKWIALARGCHDSINALAAFYGTTPTTYSRLVRGLIDPGEAFIAGALGSHPDDPAITFDALFEVVAA